ncbi:MAG TPA: hypothetical protein VFR67_19400 [Pilimelia sp.]|nr:hypothetical protein [Pilimelia sp.]
MQPDRPYQLNEVLGSCQVGTVWSAVDTQGRNLTVAVLTDTAGADHRWRDAFAAAANALADPRSGGPHVLYADFATAAPWVACTVEGGSGAERIFLALGQEYQPVPPDFGDSTGPVLGAPLPDTPAPNPPAPGVSVPDASTTADEDAEATQPTMRMDLGSGRPVNPWATGPPSPQPPIPVSPPAQPISPQPVSPPRPSPALSYPDFASSHPVPEARQPVSGSPQPVSGGPQPISGSPQPVSGGPQPVSGGPQPASGSPYAQPVSGSPQPVSGSPYPQPVSGGPQPVSGHPQPAPHAPAHGPYPPTGGVPHDPLYSPVRRIQPVTRPRRKTARWIMIAVVVLAVLAGGAGAFAWRWSADAAQPSKPSTPPASTPVPWPSASPAAPGIEPPKTGTWPAAWPRFTPTDKVRTLTGLEGLGFTLKTPLTWQCVLVGRGPGFVKYQCGVAAGVQPEIGGELIVRDCPERCPQDRQDAMRQAEEAWGLQWVRSGPMSAYAESSRLQIDGEPRYGLVVVGYWRGGTDGELDRQLVFRMTAPVDGAGQLRRVANYIRDTVIF